MNLRTAMIALAIAGTWSWAAPAATGVSAPMGSAAAEHRKEVDGLVINVGVVPTGQLLRTDAYERSSHRTAAANATHHVVVSVADAASGRPVGDATVAVELVDPKGGRQTRTLIRGDAGGIPDYSELFRFGWSGTYQVWVKVERGPDKAPVRTTLAWTEATY